MKNNIRLVALSTLSILVSAVSAFAEDAAGHTASLGSTSLIAIGAGLAVGLAALGCGLGQGKAVSAALDSVGRNPSASGKLLLPMMLGLVFVETLTILGFVVAFLLIGKI